MRVENYKKLGYKFCVRDFILSRFDTKQRDSGIKYSRKIRNLQYAQCCCALGALVLTGLPVQDFLC